MTLDDSMLASAPCRSTRTCWRRGLGCGAWQETDSVQTGAHGIRVLPYPGPTPYYLPGIAILSQINAAGLKGSCTLVVRKIVRCLIAVLAGFAMDL